MKDVYYWSSGQKFTNALKFWFNVKSTTGDFYFYLYDEQFSKVDWTVDPLQSFDELCTERAKSIRGKYDYVRLFYTGGRDSHHILNTFVKNNIRIDELLIMDFSIMPRFGKDSDIAYNAAVKLYNTYSLRMPKFTTITTDKTIYNQYFKKDYFLQYCGYGSNYNMNTNQYGCMSEALELNVPNSCDVFGYEKSKIHLDPNSNKYYFQMNDKNFIQGLGNRDNIEWFYMSGDHPLLAVKQSHLLKKHFSAIDGITENGVDKVQENRLTYDTFAKILERGESVSYETGSGINKTFGYYPDQYQEILTTAKNENWDCYCNYKDFVDHIQFLSDNGQYEFWQEANKSFAGVPTKQYYLS